MRTNDPRSCIAVLSARAADTSVFPACLEQFNKIRDEVDSSTATCQGSGAQPAVVMSSTAEGTTTGGGGNTRCSSALSLLRNALRLLMRPHPSHGLPGPPSGLHVRRLPAGGHTSRRSGRWHGPLVSAVPHSPPCP